MPTGIYKRTKPVSEETRKKLSLIHLGNMNTKGKHWKQNLTEEQREKKRILMKNIKNPHHLEPDERHYNWKGDDVGYHALHHWINKKLGRPKVCSLCGKTEGRFEWANKDHTYKRDLNDWIRLCKKCHYEYDKKSARAVS